MIKICQIGAEDFQLGQLALEGGQLALQIVLQLAGALNQWNLGCQMLDALIHIIESYNHVTLTGMELRHDVLLGGVIPVTYILGNSLHLLDHTLGLPHLIGELLLARLVGGGVAGVKALHKLA